MSVLDKDGYLVKTVVCVPTEGGVVGSEVERLLLAHRVLS